MRLGGVMLETAKTTGMITDELMSATVMPVPAI